MQATSSHGFEVGAAPRNACITFCSSLVELSRPPSPSSSLVLIFGCGGVGRVCARGHAHRRRATMRLCIDTLADLAASLRHRAGVTCSLFVPPLLMGCLAVHLSAPLVVALHGRQVMEQLSD